MSTEPPSSGDADVSGGGRSITVLVVDDNEVALRLCRRVLEKAGHTVLTASDGADGVSMALANSPDLILMDVAMPGMDGVEAMRRIKEQRPDIPIVIASVLVKTASDRKRFLAAGADHVMTRPFRLIDLTAVVAKFAANRGGQTKHSNEIPPITDVSAPPKISMEGRVAQIERPSVVGAQRRTELKDQTVELARQILDARDRYTASHSMRVAELAGRLGQQLVLGERECDLLRTAGSLHDLGKIGVRDDILNKPGQLTADEWMIMRRHADIGADMIALHSGLAEAAPLVRHHHERWDGSGYPTGLKGAAIPFGARIIAVAEAFDYITSQSLVRRDLLTAYEALRDISDHAGSWYDPAVVNALRAIHGLNALGVGDP